MSFAAYRNTFFGKGDYAEYILESIHKAEKNGRSEISLELAREWEDDVKPGQVLDWKKWDPKNTHRKIFTKSTKNIWIIKKIIPCTYYEKEKSENDSVLSVGKRVKDPARMVIKVFEGESYLPPKRKIISEKEAKDEVSDKSNGLAKEGKFLINGSGDYGRIKNICVKEVEDKELTRECKSANPHMMEIKADKIFVVVEHEDKERMKGRDGNYMFDGETSYDVDNFLRDWNIIPDDSIKDFENRMSDIEDKKELPDFYKNLAIGDGSDSISEQATNKALMGLDSKEFLRGTHKEMAIRRNDAEIIQNNMVRRIQLKKEELDRILDNKRMELTGVMANLERTIGEFKKEMSKVKRVITTLEIYLGVKENIVQIGEGKKAGKDCPISLRQMQLYMDEEYGEFKDQGLDHRNIEDFDEWLVKDRNFEKVVPEEKCVVIMRPRRYMKHYSNDRFINSQLQNNDKLVYILIRNGDNLYRIWSDKIDTQDRLFPLKTELQGVIDEIHKLESEMEEEKSEYTRKGLEDSIDRKKDKIFYYKRNFLMLQGIITRTDIFAPVPDGLNILDVRTHKNFLNFIYDEEEGLPDGRKRFKDWLENINKSIKKGSRIYFCRDVCGYNGGDWLNRLSLQVHHEHSAPPTPRNGVYEVKEKKHKVREPIWEIISEEKYNKLVKWWDGVKRKYRSTAASIPDSEYKKLKYDLEGGIYRVRSDEGEKMVRVKVLKDDTQSKKYNIYKEEEVEKRRLYVSYNPKDTVWGGWSSNYYGERRANIGFTIKPEIDEFIINYDALLLDDIEFYIESRVDRKNYLSMLPILKGIREQLREEKSQEEQFVKMLEGMLLSKYPEKLKGKNISKFIWECVEWWKNEVVTVWKRPISKNDKKAMDMIERRVKSRIKKHFNLKDIDVASNYKEKVVGWRDPKNPSKIYYGYGFSKKDFKEKLAEHEPLELKFSWKDGDNKLYSKAAVGRDMFVVEDEKLMHNAKNKKCEILVTMIAPKS